MEATSGDVIDQIHQRSKNSYGYKPNVVVINGGTNDAKQNIDIPNAGQRMVSLSAHFRLQNGVLLILPAPNDQSSQLILSQESLIRDLWAQADMGETLIVLTTVLPTTDQTGAANRLPVNEQYRNLINTLRGSGRPIVLAEMQDLITLSDLAEGTHPNDGGYRKMAWAIWVAIERANRDGLIKNSTPVESAPPTNTCEKTFGGGTWSGGLTQRGSGIGDGIYYHNSQQMDVILTIESDYDRDQWYVSTLFS